MMNLLEWNEYHNPWYIWNKCKKFFKKPKWTKYHCGKVTWFYGLPIDMRCYNSILSIKISGLGWKSKYGSPRHEWNPFVAITLFRKWQIIWMFKYPDDSTENLATWEAMLDLLYYDVPLTKLIEEHTWSTGFGETSKLITIEKNLKCCM